MKVLSFDLTGGDFQDYSQGMAKVVSTYAQACAATAPYPGKAWYELATIIALLDGARANAVHHGVALDDFLPLSKTIYEVRAIYARKGGN